VGCLELALDKELVLVVVLVVVLVWALGLVLVVLEVVSVLEAWVLVLEWLSTPSDTHRLEHGHCTQS
jgi:hypothetical protein